MERGPSAISITAGSFVRAIAVGVAFYLAYILRDLILVVLSAVVIASAAEPAARFGRRFKMNRLVSVIVLYALVTAVVVGTFYLFAPILLDDVNTLLSSLPQYVDSISVWNPLSDSAASGLGKAKEIAEGLAIAPMAADATVQDNLITTVSQASSVITQGGVLQVASYLFGGFLSLVLIVVLSFYLAVQEDGIEKFLKIVIPIKYEAYALGLWKRSQEKIALWAQGQFILALLVGILVYLGLTLLGVRNALLFALLAAIFEIIPLFGPVLAAIPAVTVSFVDGGFSAGLVTAGLYVIIQQFENHLIYPLVVRKIVGVSPILVIIALVAGFKIAGFLGVLLSVPLATILVEVLNDFERLRADHAAHP